MISTLSSRRPARRRRGLITARRKALARWESALRKDQPGRWADPLGDAIKAARAWCRGDDANAAEKEPLVAVTVDRSASRDDDAEG